MHILTMVSSANIDASSSNQRRKQVAGCVNGVTPLVRFALDATDTDFALSTGTLRSVFHIPQREHTYTDEMRALLENDDVERLVPFFKPHPNDSADLLDTAVQEVITVTLYDILGHEVDVLHDGRATSDQRVSLDLTASRLASGSYFLRVRTGTTTATERLTVVR